MLYSSFYAPSGGLFIDNAEGKHKLHAFLGGKLSLPIVRALSKGCGFFHKVVPVVEKPVVPDRALRVPSGPLSQGMSNNRARPDNRT
ncbi:MAG: hypothetical protein LKM36_11245 [Flavobacteriales bacterium]|jgi:hypothetical protein|nr:hypothetical protein [Flavobacteriales bacterium]MBP9159533.1 hypothetical protein [Flavobacteriales bacterium]MCI1753410.1 hypothetical protein [Flavobacteriales bacterium]